MSWTYKFQRFDPTATKDTNSSTRWTFNRYLYFQPDEYQNWSKGNNITNMPYSAELINNENIPSAGVALTGSLSAFYVNTVTSIDNLNSQEQPNATSYAVVTIQYENQPSPSQSGGGSSSEKQKKNTKDDAQMDDKGQVEDKPWLLPVTDFTGTPVAVSIPFDMKTTANQPINGLTTSRYSMKYTWTYYTDKAITREDYRIDQPIINDADVIIDRGVTVSAGYGVLLPPTWKKSHYNYRYKDPLDHKWKTYHQAYIGWHFQILVGIDQTDVQAYNLGTQALDANNNRYDICSWYITQPLTTTQATPVKQYGTIDEMLSAHFDVQNYNKTHTGTDKKGFQGDFISSPIPLDSTGKIDYSALSGATDPDIISKEKYSRGTWNLGWRN